MFGLFKSQSVYTVHEQPDPPADREDRAERLKFVREGFSLFAFLVPPLWMIANRLWLVLIGYFLLLGALHGLITLLEIPEHWRYYTTLAVSLLVGFEADSLERWSLERRDWRTIGSVSGSSFEECERRFFEFWVPTVAMVTPSNFDKPGNFEAAGQSRVREGDVIPPKRTRWRSEGGWTGWQRS
ncbi:MAG: DUF2628 domain-containing protein [Alphaproteobacteria bacterium]|nr:DUF2628 domain-containing protein [Alphaproteobacteria bacterium]